MHSGLRRLVCNGVEFDLAAGDVLALNPGDVHACASETSEVVSYDSVGVERRVIASLAGSPQVRLRGPVVRDTEVAESLKELIRLLGGEGAENTAGKTDAAAEDAEGVTGETGAPNAANAEGAAYAEGVEEALCEVLSQLLDDDDAGFELSLPQQGEREHAIEQAFLYMQVHLGARVALDDLAQASGLSKYQVVRGFTRKFGMTPNKLLLSLRVERACSMLAEGVEPAEVAQALGFADQAHLTRVFRQRVGFTPGAYRRALRQRGETVGGKRFAFQEVPQQAERRVSRPATCIATGLAPQEALR